MRTKHSQRGGVYGKLFTLGVLGIAVLVALKVVPIYLNHMKVVAAVNQITDNPQYTNATVYDIRRDMQRRWDVESVDYLQVKDVKIVKDSNGRALQYDYEVRTPLVANWDLVLWFKDKKLITGRGANT